ncbi:malate synthase G [Nocardioides sp. JQ2195]|uniref:malate synthase G n=1 Tax=Nocardioides sp. JQ2195 TaxID=2592334 RepID=UPI00143E6F22|nr:malate synthase G [Nocardioides sp. JQ2195]QIX26478.1 malate synthase G [Nocardioides sp. JQ2195]
MTTPARVRIGTLQIDASLHRFIEEDALPGSGVSSESFWAGLDAAVHELAPRNRELLLRRAELQAAIDDHHRAPGQSGTVTTDPSAHEAFLREIGYLEDEPDPFEITTGGVDPEVALQAGPQLVVPMLNARFATNAANARWGSLYDALYGTDVIPETEGRERGAGYNVRRGAEVISRSRAFLDAHFPLADGLSHVDVTAYAADADGLRISVGDRVGRLAEPEQFVGHRGAEESPTAIVLVHHGLHVEIQVDRTDPIGATDPAGVKDLLLEAAVSAIMDLEDSVAAVDSGDKVLGYRNWLLLMQGRLAEEVTKDGRTFTRTMHPDRTCTTPAGETLTLPGRALLFVRQVGLLMTTDAVLDRDGNAIPEGILDAFVTGLGSTHDLRGHSDLRNSRAGSMYVVKPKLHGPHEVAFTCDLFDRVETALGLAARTVKLGIMDEERRTSVNLRACIRAAQDRVAFINTGFLDRTGDEIHTSMLAGPMVPKAEMKAQPWISAYEDANVDAGLACGFTGRAQIGKGMWAAPDNLAEMLEQKVAHPLSGASTAWVPSPTAATLHALHYHEVDVWARQRELRHRDRAALADLLTIPVGRPGEWSADRRRSELENNLQGTLGYVVRWVDAGVGCSKVPDIHGTPLMEDRATCRISSQHVANWVLHGVVSLDEVEEALERMARVVDEQNADDPDYVPMAPSFDGSAYLAARDLVLRGTEHPSGYTEPVLHASRVARKQQLERTEA